MRKPAPRSENSWIAARRLRASRGQDLVARHEQVAERQPVAAADAAAELVELRQAEALGVIDEDRVAGRDVDAVLDDRRRQQHVVLALDEGEHRPLQLALLHLPVADDDACRPGTSFSRYSFIA